MSVLDYNVRRVMAVDSASLESELSERMLGVELTDEKLGAKKPAGDMIWYTPEGGDASYASITDEELAGVGDRNIGVDANGKLKEVAINTNPSQGTDKLNTADGAGGWVETGIESHLVNTDDWSLSNDGTGKLILNGGDGVDIDSPLGGDISLQARTTIDRTFTDDLEVVNKKYVDDNAGGAGLWQEDTPTGLLKPLTVHDVTAMAIDAGTKVAIGTEIPGAEGKLQIVVSSNGGTDLVVTGSLSGTQDGTYLKELAQDPYGFDVYKRTNPSILYVSKDSSPSHPYWCIDTIINPVYFNASYILAAVNPDGQYVNPIDAGDICSVATGGGTTSTALHTNGKIVTSDNLEFEGPIGTGISFAAGKGILGWGTNGTSEFLGFATNDTDQVAFSFASGGIPRLSIPSSGAGNATQMYRSLLLGGYVVGSESSESDTNVGNSTLFDASYIDCNTGVAGADAKPDVGIGGALQVIDGILVGADAQSGRKVLINADDANETILLDTGINTPQVSLSDKGVSVSTGLASTSTYVTPNNIRFITSGGSQVLRNIYSALYGATSSKIMIESPASDVSIATIDLIGVTALITKEYADANYGGSGGGATVIASGTGVLLTDQTGANTVVQLNVIATGALATDTVLVTFADTTTMGTVGIMNTVAQAGQIWITVKTEDWTVADTNVNWIVLRS